MSAAKFIEALQQRGLVSDRVVQRLREQIANAGQPPTARALANFLVNKGKLTEQQASEVLDALAEDLSAAATEIPGPVADAPPPPAEPDDQADDDEEASSSSSSIFSPAAAGSGQFRADDMGDFPRMNEDELTLTPIDDDEQEEEGEPPVDVDHPIVPPSGSVVVGWSEVEGSAVFDNPPPMPDVNAPRHPPGGDEPSVRRPLDRPSPSRRDEAEGSIVQQELAQEPEPPKARKKKKQPKKPAKRKNEWDSPLLLVGGGALILLVVCGLVVAWLMRQEGGDERLQAARQSLNDGSYTQAISEYEKFLDDYPNHRDRSQARVWLAVARLRQMVETSADYRQALAVAQQELDAVEDEEKFNEVQYELAALLPRVAAGLADRAKAAADPAEVRAQIDEATAALALCTNTAYIPKSLRDEAELDGVRETLEVVQRRLQSHEDLQQTLAAMDAAAAAGDTPAAYQARRDLLKTHPELSNDESLAAAVARVSAAEQAGIHFVADEQAAETTERPTPWVASLALAHRSRTSPSPDTGVACVRVDAAVYGLDVASGQLLWQRLTGFDPSASSWPILVGDDVLVVDAVHHELLRLEGATGRLRWRQSLGEPVAPPLVVGERVFVAARSGRLYLVDLASGTRLGYLQFAQPLLVPPTADRHGERLYLTGNHSSLYAISLADLTCLGVYYLGHSAGSIQVAPALVTDKLAVLEDDGVATCRLQLLALNDDGTIAGPVAERRLTGLAAGPPLVAGRRLIVATDRGQIDVFEVAAGQGDESLIAIATREATEDEPLVRHLLLADGHIWVGDTQLTKYAVLPTGNRLPVQSIDDDFANSTFDHALELFGTTLVHVSRPAQRAGVVVAATDIQQGHGLWATELAVPAAAAPAVSPSPPSLVVASASGHVFLFDEAAIRSRVQDQPLDARGQPARPPVLTAGTDLGNGRAVFGAPGNSDRLLLVDSSQADQAAQWARLPSPLACATTPFADGLLAPMDIGQVAYVDPASGVPLAAPLEPRLRPRTRLAYQPAGVVPGDARQFVIADGYGKVYLGAVADRPQPHLETLAEAEVSSYPAVGPIVVLGDAAILATAEPRLLSLRLPKLEVASDVALPADVVWGPFGVADRALLATSDGNLAAVVADGSVVWSVPLAHGELAGPPLATDDGVLLAYRNGVLQRIGLANGAPLAEIDVEQPLATGPVRFLGRIVLTAHDGTLLVVDQP